MCQITAIPQTTTQAVDRGDFFTKRPTSPEPKSSTLKNWLGNVWPVHPLVIAALLPFLPTSLYLNRGFTIWFHHLTITYILTQSDFLRKFLITLGIGICSGWYGATLYELLRYGRFMTMLYQNAPRFMRDMIFTDESMDEFLPLTMIPITNMVCVHILDSLGHPILTWAIWKSHCRNGGTWKDCVSWPIILSTCLLSRAWSSLHMYYNYGELGLFYVGHDIYNVKHMESWYIAYSTELLFYSCVVAWKLTRETSSTPAAVKTVETKHKKYDQKPSLVYSDSGVSSDGFLGSQE